jgi:hypothetical protein
MMDCERRIRYGWCDHDQCPHPKESGYNCVKTLATPYGLYCTLGEGCYDKCPFSYPPASPAAAAMTDAVKGES